MDISLKNKLLDLATQNETSAFIKTDPCQFLYDYTDIVDKECAGFIAAAISFGNRKQFLPKLKSLFNLADKTSGSISKWIISKEYEKSFSSLNDFEKSEKKFYRFYSYKDMEDFFCELSEILKNNSSLGEYFFKIWEKEKDNYPHLCHCIGKSFKSPIIPKGKNSPCKRTNMFLRWMVRQNSPVDLGLWNWFSPKDLIIPLDTHVLQEGKKLGIIPEAAGGTFSTAEKLTMELKEIWPENPVKGDFALYGVGAISNIE